MIYSRPTNADLIPYSAVKIDGCSEARLGFDFLSEQPSTSRRRYCNKVLVHECVTVPEVEPLALERVEFLATDDPCYTFFNLFKSSNTVGDTEPTIELQLDEDDLVIGVLINFTREETCCLPLRMSYRLNAYDEDGTKMTLSQGNIYVSPCPMTADCERATWVDVEW